MAQSRPKEDESVSDATDELRLEIERCRRELDASRKRVRELERGERLLAGENRLLEMVAKGNSLTEIMAAHCLLIEELSPGSLCGILLLDESNHRVEHVAGPSLPTAYNAAIHHRVAVPEAGPCGMAVCLKKQVVATDVDSDPRWESGWRSLALGHGLRACWSTPIQSGDGNVLGTFAIYWREPRSPAVQDQQLIGQTTHLASIAIERRRIEEKLRRNESSFTEAIDTIPGLVWSVRPDGEVDFLNQRWREYTGMKLAEARGWGWSAAIHPDDVERLEGYWRSVLASGKPGEIEARLRRFDGAYRWFLFRAVPLYDDTRQLIKWYGQNTDIDDRKHAEERLRQGEAYLREAQRLSLTGSFGLKVTTGELVWSDETFCILGYPRTITPTLDLVFERVHPDDLVRVRNAIEAAMRDRADSDFEHRLLMPDATVKYVHVMARATRSDCGQLELVGAVMDITERKQAAEALRASEHLARGQVDALARSLATLSRESVPEKFLEHVLCIAGEQLDAAGVSVWEMNAESGCVELAANYQNDVLRLPGKNEGPPPLCLGGSAAEHPVWTEFFRTGRQAVYGWIQNSPPWSQVAIHPEGPWHDWRAGMVDHPVVPQMIKDLAASGIVATLNVPMFVADKVTGLFVLCFKKRRLFRADEIELTRAMANQAMLAIQLMRLSQAHRESAVIAERNRMARDIHDTLAQGFTGVIMQLEAAKGAMANADTPSVQTHIERAEALARASLGEARRSVRAMRLRSLEDGTLSTALDDLFKQMTNGTQLHAELVVQGAPRPMPPIWEEGLLRIAQESLTNTLKYAHARHFGATLSFSDNLVRLQLADDGLGFDPKSEHEGFGLLGMRERTEQMSGNFILRSNSGQGTEIVVELNHTSTANGRNENTRA